MEWSGRVIYNVLFGPNKCFFLSPIIDDQWLKFDRKRVVMVLNLTKILKKKTLYTAQQLRLIFLVFYS